MWRRMRVEKMCWKTNLVEMLKNRAFRSASVKTYLGGLLLHQGSKPQFLYNQLSIRPQEGGKKLIRNHQNNTLPKIVLLGCTPGSIYLASKLLPQKNRESQMQDWVPEIKEKSRGDKLPSECDLPKLITSQFG